MKKRDPQHKTITEEMRKLGTGAAHDDAVCAGHGLEQSGRM